MRSFATGVLVTTKSHDQRERLCALLRYNATFPPANRKRSSVARVTLQRARRKRPKRNYFRACTHNNEQQRSDRAQ